MLLLGTSVLFLQVVATSAQWTGTTETACNDGETRSYGSCSSRFLRCRCNLWIPAVCPGTSIFDEDNRICVFSECGITTTPASTYPVTAPTLPSAYPTDSYSTVPTFAPYSPNTYPPQAPSAPGYPEPYAPSIPTVQPQDNSPYARYDGTTSRSQYQSQENSPKDGYNANTAAPLYQPRDNSPVEKYDTTTSVPQYQSQENSPEDGYNANTAAPSYQPRDNSPVEKFDITTSVPQYQSQENSPGDGYNANTAAPSYQPLDNSPVEKYDTTTSVPQYQSQENSPDDGYNANTPTFSYQSQDNSAPTGYGGNSPLPYGVNVPTELSNPFFVDRRHGRHNRHRHRYEGHEEVEMRKLSARTRPIRVDDRSHRVYDVYRAHDSKKLLSSSWDVFPRSRVHRNRGRKYDDEYDEDLEMRSAKRTLNHTGNVSEDESTTMSLDENSVTTVLETTTDAALLLDATTTDTLLAESSTGIPSVDADGSGMPFWPVQSDGAPDGHLSRKKRYTSDHNPSSVRCQATADNSILSMGMCVQNFVVCQSSQEKLAACPVGDLFDFDLVRCVPASACGVVNANICSTGTPYASTSSPYVAPEVATSFYGVDRSTFVPVYTKEPWPAGSSYFSVEQATTLGSVYYPVEQPTATGTPYYHEKDTSDLAVSTEAPYMPPRVVKEEVIKTSHQATTTGNLNLPVEQPTISTPRSNQYPAHVPAYTMGSSTAGLPYFPMEQATVGSVYYPAEKPIVATEAPYYHEEKTSEFTISTQAPYMPSGFVKEEVAKTSLTHATTQGNLDYLVEQPIAATETPYYHEEETSDLTSSTEAPYAPPGVVKEEVVKTSPSIIYLTLSSNRSEFCVGRGDALYRDPQKCSGIIQCHGGEMFQHNGCPSGLVFNDRKQQCDYKNQVPECDHPERNPAAETGCKGAQHGAYLPDKENCRVFYRCVWNRLEKMNCPTGTFFNPSLSVCDWPYNAPKTCSAASSSGQYL